MNKRYLQANLGTIAGLIALILCYVFKINLYVGSGTIAAFTIISFGIFHFADEYQRITLIIGRCVKLKIGEAEQIGVADIQEILSSSTLGFIIFIDSIVFGIIAGYLLRINIIYLVVVFLIKYLILALIPIPIPFGLIFRLIDKEKAKADIELMKSGKIQSMLTLISTYKEIPHNKTYEDWAYKKYGNVLSHLKI